MASTKCSLLVKSVFNSLSIKHSMTILLCNKTGEWELYFHCLCFLYSDVIVPNHFPSLMRFIACLSLLVVDVIVAVYHRLLVQFVNTFTKPVLQWLESRTEPYSLSTQVPRHTKIFGALQTSTFFLFDQCCLL